MTSARDGFLGKFHDCRDFATPIAALSKDGTGQYLTDIGQDLPAQHFGDRVVYHLSAYRLHLTSTGDAVQSNLALGDHEWCHSRTVCPTKKQ